MVVENDGVPQFDRSDFNPAGALAAARVMPAWLATKIFPFGFCLRRTLVSKVQYNRRAEEIIEAAFTTIPDVTTYRPAMFVLTSRMVGGFIYSANRVYSRLELLVAAALVDAWVADEQPISRSEENKWYGGLRAGMFLDGENLYLVDYPFWSQNWQDRLRQNRLACPCANPVVILYAEKAREPLAPGTRIRPFPWTKTFIRGVSNGLKTDLASFVSAPFYRRSTHWNKGVFLDGQQDPEPKV